MDGRRFNKEDLNPVWWWMVAYSGWYESIHHKPSTIYLGSTVQKYCKKFSLPSGGTHFCSTQKHKN